MSFLTPSTQGPNLGVGIDALIRLRDAQPEVQEPDVILAARSAEEAGADAILLSIPSKLPAQASDDAKTMIGAVTQGCLVIPLSSAMIDFASTVRPYSVYFKINDDAHHAVHGGLISDDTLHLLQQAISQLQRLSIQVIASISPTTEQLPALREAGVTAVALSTRRFSQAPSSLQAEELNELRTAVRSAVRCGMAVHLGGGISYRNVAALASLGTITQMNIGYSITARAVVIGWQEAIKEMKALLIAAWAPSPNGETENSDAFKYV